MGLAKQGTFRIPQIPPFAPAQVFKVNADTIAAGLLSTGCILPSKVGLLISRSFQKKILDCSSQSVSFDFIRVNQKRLPHSPYNYVKTVEDVGYNRFFSIDQLLAILHLALQLPDSEPLIDLYNDDGPVRNAFLVKTAAGGNIVTVEHTGEEHGFIIDCVKIDDLVLSVQGGVTIYFN
jgi:hypothetical protein